MALTLEQQYNNMSVDSGEVRVTEEEAKIGEKSSPAKEYR